MHSNSIRHLVRAFAHRSMAPMVGALSLLAGAAPLGCGSDEADDTTSASGTSSGTGSGGEASGGSGGSTGEGGATGGQPGSGGEAVGTAWEAYCQASVERDEMCDPSNPPSPGLRECVAAEQCFAALFREDTREPIMECLSTRPCDKSDDACFIELAAELPATAEQDAYESTCLETLETCKSFSNDWCTGGDIPWQFFPSELYQGLGACFTESCELVSDCLGAVLDGALAPCDGEAGF